MLTPFVAEVAVDLENLLEPAHHELLQVQLRRDAQVELHVERVVMRHERPRGGAARDRMHHRRLDLEVAARHEEFADRLHDLRSLDEHVARRGIGDEVHVALAIALLLVRHAVELLGQRTQSLGEQAHLACLDRELAGARLEEHAGGSHDVAQVPVLEGVERFLAHAVDGDVELDAAGHVLQRGEARLAHHALQQHAARDAHRDALGLELLVGLAAVARVEVARERVAAEIVGIRLAGGAQCRELVTALGDDLVLVLRGDVRHGAAS